MTKKRFDLTAIIYDRKGRPLSIGKNSYTKTHPYQASCARRVGLPDKIFLHAEIHAILRCQDLSRAYRIVVFRYDEKGNPKNAKPCPVCAEAIKVAGIKIIEHT